MKSINLFIIVSVLFGTNSILFCKVSNEDLLLALSGGDLKKIQTFSNDEIRKFKSADGEGALEVAVKFAAGPETLKYLVEKKGLPIKKELLLDISKVPEDLFKEKEQIFLDMATYILGKTIKKKDDIKTLVDEEGKNVLHNVQLNNKNINFFKFFVNKGADPNLAYTITKNGESRSFTPFDLAVGSFDKPLINFLLPKVDITTLLKALKTIEETEELHRKMKDIAMPKFSPDIQALIDKEIRALPEAQAQIKKAEEEQKKFEETCNAVRKTIEDEITKRGSSSK